jgi:hypothetical protein
LSKKEAEVKQIKTAVKSKIRNEVNSGNSQMPPNVPTVAPILKQKK